jgi:hypothetical protein
MVRIEPLEKMVRPLADIGARPGSRRIEQRSGEQTPVWQYLWRRYEIETAWNIADGLTVALRPEGADQSESIYVFTVPNFKRFDDDQNLAWLLSVPDGEAYPDFVASHIRKLPTSVPA